MDTERVDDPQKIKKNMKNLVEYTAQIIESVNNSLTYLPLYNFLFFFLRILPK